MSVSLSWCWRARILGPTWGWWPWWSAPWPWYPVSPSVLSGLDPAIITKILLSHHPNISIIHLCLLCVQSIVWTCPLDMSSTLTTCYFQTFCPQPTTIFILRVWPRCSLKSSTLPAGLVDSCNQFVCWDKWWGHRQAELSVRNIVDGVIYTLPASNKSNNYIVRSLKIN